ncbi:MAG: winged helix DNA-binding protein [Candidatus Andeanibacterium colombiense]|uniref:Winged helix DNA-binding protein n=1 Tax=Candidatus Andeanibacterium colombiense TaxID=3121345 RepID=A0AAJ6BP00_9SPHN|nr:MAG: winged helix DNA-binding protein [Sphingomonadaceae bacterium]
MSRSDDENPADEGLLPEDLRLRLIAEQDEWIGFRMILIGNYFSAPLFARLQKEYGLLRDEFVVLANLQNYGPLTANVICGLSGRPKNSISRGVIKLTKEEMLVARTDPGDRRNVILTITEKGSSLLNEVIELFREREQLVFGTLTARETNTLDRLLAKVLLNWHRGSQNM